MLNYELILDEDAKSVSDNELEESIEFDYDSILNESTEQIPDTELEESVMLDYEYVLNESKKLKGIVLQEDNIGALAQRINDEMRKNNSYLIDKSADNIIGLNRKRKEDEQRIAMEGLKPSGMFYGDLENPKEVRTPKEMFEFLESYAKNSNYDYLKNAFKRNSGRTILMNICNAYVYGNETDSVPMKFIYPKASTQQEPSRA